MGKTCFFIGHHDAPEALGPLLVESVERHITEYGVDHFVVGQYGSFDRMAAGAVRAAKQHHPQVMLTGLLPYYRQDTAKEPLLAFDDTFYPPGMETVPKRFAIVRANAYMVRHCDCLIAYAKHPGNAKKLLDTAKSREVQGLLHIENLAEAAGAIFSR